jgi:hypothetical protein
MLLLIDDSMSGWRPKTKKLGGLPNYTFESCKPVPLGNIFCNAVECISGLLVVQDVVKNSEQKSRRITVLFDPPCLTKATEVLRLAEGADITQGGWVGGDSWFGSVMRAVEVCI